MVGFIQAKREHVHLTHLERNRAVNPLAPGHLTPYRDTTAPRILGISIERDAHGRVDILVNAADMPALQVPGRWHGCPVTPALLAWRIERGGHVVISKRIARDVRRSVPKNDRFWETFGRGTHQNWPIFRSRKYQLDPGRYLFELTVQPFDTRRLETGDYELVVIAADTAGNRGQGRVRFTVDNRA